MKNLAQFIRNRLLNLSKFLLNSRKICRDITTSLYKYMYNRNNNALNHNQARLISSINKGLGIFFLVGCLILASVPTVLCRTTAPIVYVAGDGSGDFNCDGKDDHIQINQALKFVADNSKYTTVYLKGPFTYVIDDTLLIGSNTILEGDSTAVIKLVDNAGWATMKPLIKQMSSYGIIIS